MGYAELAREEVAWARRSFTRALVLEPDHEDALSGYGETLLRLGDRKGAVAAFDRILALGFQEDHDLMMQLGRALFRDGLLAPAYRFFDLAAAAEPECEEAAACMGYVTHRLGRESAAIYWLRRALEIDAEFAEARIYLANLLYDRGESGAALRHLEKTAADEHYDEIGLYRTIELKKTFYRLAEDDRSLRPWQERLAELAPMPDPTEDLLAELESTQPDGSLRDPHQLELFGTLLVEPHQMQRRPSRIDHHIVATLSGQTLRGTWDEILEQLKASEQAKLDQSMYDFMAELAQRGKQETGVTIPLTSAEAFIRGTAEAGELRIIH
jgi:Tfp pilus assembly protein PilF